jgi:protein TonB
MTGTPERKHGFGPLASTVLHAAGIALLLVAVAKAPRVLPVKLPGVANGKHLMLTYSTGSPASAAAALAPKPTAPAKSQMPQPHKPKATVAAEVKPLAEQGTGTSGLAALGSGNMTIAALKIFPHPEPDLSTMPHGRGGNVILDAVIDAHGAITQLTIVQSLGPAIDQQVLAAVRAWSYVPATRDGQPIASEQEIVLHYERG